MNCVRQYKNMDPFFAKLENMIFWLHNYCKSGLAKKTNPQRDCDEIL